MPSLAASLRVGSLFTAATINRRLAALRSLVQLAKTLVDAAYTADPRVEEAIGFTGS